jgi:hypothetical protein
MIAGSCHTGLSSSQLASCSFDAVRLRSARSRLTTVPSVTQSHLDHRAILHPGLTHRTSGRQCRAIHGPASA